ncbi:hypothetical protein DRE_02946 [Drechslerella stenobrocha 248]|uniref:Uncharacterized protein n=1 Tax=Drechslerella stenobrocha 248 TaxID=1043628 RepID=W7HU79_9PEZI|nr:hypothetical protein DRE_02946 [Drechslerella stenobrocha 248]
MNPNANQGDKPPGYEEPGHASNQQGLSGASSAQETSGLQNMAESTGLASAARRIGGAGDYVRHTILGYVDRLTGDTASADEKDRLAARGYEQMNTGKEQPPAGIVQTPIPVEYYANEVNKPAAITDPSVLGGPDPKEKH